MGSHTKKSPDGHGGGADVRAVLDAVRRIVGVLRVGSRAAERGVGLSGAQVFVLHKLADGPARSVNELAGRTRTHQSSVSVVVGRLVERGLVTRARAGADGRRAELSLTPAGRALACAAPDAAQERLIAAIEGLPPAGRRQLAALLGQVVDGLGAAAGPAAMFFEDGAASPAEKPDARRTRVRKQPAQSKRTERKASANGGA